MNRKLGKLLEDEPDLLHRLGGLIQLIVELVQSLSASSTSPIPFLVIIDGLDECQGNDAQSLVLKNVLDLIHQHHLPLKFLIVSRPEPHIRHMFSANAAMVQVSKQLSLYGGLSASHDVRKFLSSEFERIASSEKHQATMQFVPRPWPSDEAIQELVQRSEGYFIYAFTAIKFIDEEYFSSVDRLDQVLGLSEPSSTVFAELDKLYTQILSSCTDSALLKRILGFVVFTAFFPTVSQIEVILNVRPGKVLLTLRGMHSLFTFHGPSWNCTIVPVHASFGDFIQDEDRSKTYHINSNDWYKNILRDILKATSNGHTRNPSCFRYVCDLVCEFSVLRRFWHGISSESMVPFFIRFISLSFEARGDDKALWIPIIEESIKADPWDACIVASGDFPDSEKFQAVDLLATLVKEIHPVPFPTKLTSIRSLILFESHQM